MNTRELDALAMLGQRWLKRAGDIVEARDTEHYQLANVLMDCAIELDKTVEDTLKLEVREILVKSGLRGE